MQIKNIIGNKKSILLILVKVGFLVAALQYVWRDFESKGARATFDDYPDNCGVLILICVLLMCVNWGLEAYRWKVSVGSFQSLSMAESTKVVLGGLAMNLVIPFTVGDALARVLSLRNKYQATSAMMLNRGIMLIITLSYGAISLHAYFNKEVVFLPDFSWVLLPGILVLVFWRGLIRKLTIYFRELSLKLAISIVLLSVLRYLVFVFQAYLLIRLFLPSLTDEAVLLGIGWVFLAKSVIPSFFGGIGIREASGLFFFTELMPGSTVIIVPIFIIWIINTMIPSLFGLASIWNFKFKIARWSFSSQG